MDVIVVGAGVTGIACAHSLLKHGHKVTLIDEASGPNQGCSFGMNGFMGARSVQMLSSPFAGKAGLASFLAKTRRVGWDVTIGQMRFLLQLANARSRDKWLSDRAALSELARYSVGLTEFVSRLEDISFDQIHGLLKVFTNEQAWEEAHKDLETWKGGEWKTVDETKAIDASVEEVQGLLGSYFMPQELCGNGTYFSKQLQQINNADSNLTVMYHTKALDLIREDKKVTGIKTDKGDIYADAVVLSNNLGAVSLIEGIIALPIQTLTGWTVTAGIDAMDNAPRHTIEFSNKDVLVSRFGNRLRVSGRFWIGEVTKDLSEKVPNELYESACELLPHGALWRESTHWEGKVLITPDSLPVCGETEYEGLYLNICHGVNGWCLSMGCAELIASAIGGEVCAIDSSPYLASRFTKK